MEVEMEMVSWMGGENHPFHPKENQLIGASNKR